jgi:hypothetical protein
MTVFESYLSRAVREAGGQHALAEMLGLTQQTIARWAAQAPHITGRSVAGLRGLAGLLGLDSPQSLFEPALADRPASTDHLNTPPGQDTVKVVLEAMVCVGRLRCRYSWDELNAIFKEMRELVELVGGWPVLEKVLYEVCMFAHAHPDTTQEV